MTPQAAPSPNFGPRRGGCFPDIVVIHHTAMATAEAALLRLCDRTAEVSSHYLIAEDGRVWRLVDEAARAWHAGEGAWGAVRDVNSRSIGIELANPGPLDGFPPFPEPQMAALEALLDGVVARWRIPPDRVIGHSDIAPGRKADPGAKFDWRRLAQGGRAVWVAPDPVADIDRRSDRNADADWRAFRDAATRAGYVAPAGDWTEVLAASRLRFRPWALGPGLAPADISTIAALAAAHPCVDAAPVRA